MIRTRNLVKISLVINLILYFLLMLNFINNSNKVSINTLKDVVSQINNNEDMDGLRFGRIEREIRELQNKLFELELIDKKTQLLVNKNESFGVAINYDPNVIANVSLKGWEEFK